MILEELRLNGNTAVLVGRKKDYLQEIASTLVEAGVSLVVAAPENRLLPDAVEDAVDAKAKVISTVVDPESPDEVARLADLAFSTFGQIDILVNDLTVPFAKPFQDMTPSDWQRTIGANLNSLFTVVKGIGVRMRASRSGRIVNIVPGVVERGLPNATAYCASMGAISQLSRALALEWADHNVRINTIGVGWSAGSGFTEKEEDVLSRYIPLRRLCRPEDISPLVLFLVSSASSYMTGYTCHVDGGLMARG
jgi:NAD(P)-dependent dehydrogenase (short-subunit alcohol dehydrogenase family)